MKCLRPLLIVVLLLSAPIGVASSAPVLEEHVTGGALDLVWNPGFGLSSNLQPLTMDGSDPAYANPSGDHTVGDAANSFAPDSGGIILSATDPGALSDYSWEGYFFTGAGNSRRGLVVRADPSNGFQSHYQLTIRSGLLSIDFRKLVNSTPTTLATWSTTTLPNGIPAANSWHSMKIVAVGSAFQCFFDGVELTTTPILDSDFATGYPGCYNFAPFTNGVHAYFDDLLLSPADLSTGGASSTWGSLKARYR